MELPGKKKILVYLIVASSVTLSVYGYIRAEVPSEERREVRKEILLDLVEGPRYLPPHHFKKSYNFSPLELWVSRLTREKAYYYVETKREMYGLTSTGRWVGYALKNCRETGGNYSLKTGYCFNSPELSP